MAGGQLVSLLCRPAWSWRRSCRRLWLSMLPDPAQRAVDRWNIAPDFTAFGQQQRPQVAAYCHADDRPQHTHRGRRVMNRNAQLHQVPGWWQLSHVIAIAQLVTSFLRLTVAGGRTEGQAHTFASLAGLASYLDWTVLLTAVFVALLSHALRAALLFGSTSRSYWAWMKPAAWIALAGACLLWLIIDRWRTLRTREKQQVAADAVREKTRTDISISPEHGGIRDDRMDLRSHQAPIRAASSGDKTSQAGIAARRSLSRPVRPDSHVEQRPGAGESIPIRTASRTASWAEIFALRPTGSES